MPRSPVTAASCTSGTEPGAINAFRIGNDGSLAVARRNRRPAGGNRRTGRGLATATPPWGVSVPGRRVVHPAAADHRRDDLDLAQLLRLDRERVAVEDDEVGEQAREQASSAALVAGEPRRASTQVACSACSTVTASSGRQAGRSSIERSTPAAMPAERVELLDRRVGAVRDDARPTRAASGTRTCRRAAPARSARRGRGPRARARTARSRRRRAPRSGGGPRPRGTARARSGGAAASAARRSRVASNASSASRFAWSPIACTATGQPASAPRRTISSSSSRLVICTPLPS